MILRKATLMTRRSTPKSIESTNDREAQLAEHIARVLINSSPAVHYLARISENYATMFISESVRTQLGYDPVQFTREPDFWIDNIHPDDRPRVTSSLSRIFDTGRHQQEYRFRHSDGRWRWMHDESVLVRDEDGEPLEIAGAWLDVTEHRESEASLAREKAFSDSLIETAPTVVLLLGPDGRIMDINPYMERLSGYSAEEVVGKDWFATFLPEDDRPEIHGLFDTVMATGVNSGHTNPIVAKDGTVRQIEWHAKILEDGEGKRIGLLNIGHDVTERIEYEAALKEARQHAEEANASKSRLLAAASHDLRQPLYALRLFLGALIEEPNSPGRVGICEKMQETIDTMAELLDALLDISKLESGSVSPQIKDFPVQALLHRVVLANQQQAEEKGLQLVCAGDDCIVRSDPVLLERIVNNFVDNAIRYTDRGNVSMACHRSKDSARIEVSDTGRGIAKEHLERIFEEYSQLDNPGRDRRKGLGLGLAIVKHIARILDHAVEVTSAPEEGSRFSVQVPLGRRTAEELEPHKHIDTTTHEEHRALVLLVEDDPAIVDGTTMLLELRGARVISSCNADEALARLKEGVHPNVIISDYRLPGDTGIDVIRRIREALGKDIPAVLVTGDTSLAETPSLKELPACSVLYKPIDSGRLTELIEDLVPPGSS